MGTNPQPVSYVVTPRVAAPRLASIGLIIHIVYIKRRRGIYVLHYIIYLILNKEHIVVPLTLHDQRKRQFFYLELTESFLSAQRPPFRSSHP